MNSADAPISSGPLAVPFMVAWFGLLGLAAFANVLAPVVRRWLRLWAEDRDLRRRDRVRADVAANVERWARDAEEARQ